jgi:hypothetical protein
MVVRVIVDEIKDHGRTLVVLDSALARYCCTKSPPLLLCTTSAHQLPSSTSAQRSTAPPWSTNHCPEPRPAPTSPTPLQSPVVAHSMRVNKHLPGVVPQCPSNRRWDLEATNRTVLVNGARVHRTCSYWLELKVVKPNVPRCE